MKKKNKRKKKDKSKIGKNLIQRFGGQQEKGKKVYIFQRKRN